jgi:hypothetical protein
MNQLAKAIVDIATGEAAENVQKRGRPGGLNFARIHQPRRVTPAMAAGVTDRLWSVEGTAALLNQ